MGIKLNPFTGKFDLVNNSSGSGGSDNFSYTYILTGTTVTIPLYQQMIVLDSIEIDGTLTINGELVLID